MDCISDISPLLTKPTTMTVVAELDWMTQVTPMPATTAIRRLSVTALIQRLRRGPAMACMPSDIIFMPSRKMPRPPTTLFTISRYTLHSMSRGCPGSVRGQPRDLPARRFEPRIIPEADPMRQARNAASRNVVAKTAVA